MKLPVTSWLLLCVVDDLLAERLADALDRAAVDLAARRSSG